MVTLCLDFGNTAKKAALFDGDIFREQFYLTDDSEETIRSLVETFRPQASILSSVIVHNPAVESILQENGHFHLLTASTKLNFISPVGNPASIGADRLALCAAAVHYFPEKNNLIIGLGSCITYNFINTKHQFLGGAIAPGMDMRFKSMHEHTAKLPLATADFSFPLIGYDTATNLQSGVLYGMVHEIDGFIQQYQNRYGNFNAVLTGGNSAFFAGQLKCKIFADNHFLFKGLYALSKINFQNTA
jgi:type III pantothenate kinase